MKRDEVKKILMKLAIGYWKCGKDGSVDAGNNLVDQALSAIEKLEVVDETTKCIHIYESNCHGIEMIKSPSGKEWAIGGTNTEDRWLYDPWCGGKLNGMDDERDNNG